MEPTADVAKRLWALCSVLRDDGITYHEYISELSQLLFLYLASILGVQDSIPQPYQWRSLINSSEDAILNSYQEALKNLSASSNPIIRSIFVDSKSDIRTGASLLRIMRGIDTMSWGNANSHSIGDIYESLIEKNAQESRYGAGQYFTPRAVVEAIVAVTKPRSGDTVYDPAAGTGGFLISAGLYALKHDRAQCNLSGYELVRDVERMAQMNLHLHGLQASMRTEDSLAINPAHNQYSLCLSNPPFGVKAGLSNKQLELLDFPTNNKQLAFLQHVYKSLAPNGRAAVIVPDNVLFESGQAASVRKHLLDHFNLHTILRLPTGIFYATGIRTSVLFFSKRSSTENMWIYDLRNINSSFTKRRQISTEHLEDFIATYGADPLGLSKRSSSLTFQPFHRSEIQASQDRLDLLHSTTGDSPDSSPLARLDTMAGELEQAAIAIKNLQQLLGTKPG